MKKVLFATTALVATAGVAAADVTLTGSAEMGIVGGNGTNTVFHQDLDVTFTMSGTTDNGLTFGASVDLDESDDDGGATGSGAFAPEDDGGATVFISGNFGTLTMGDTDGALDWALTEAGNVANPGSIADDETSHLAYLGSYGDGYGDGQILRYDNTFGDFGVAVSVEQTDEGGETGYAVGLRYGIAITGGEIDLGAGFQRSYTRAVGAVEFGNINIANGIEVEIIGVSATVMLDSGFSGGLTYSTWDFNGGVGEVDHVSIGLGYETGPFAIHANYGEYSSNTFAALDGFDGFGMAARYDLGGGAGIHLGYNDNPTGANWSLGVAMSF